MKCGGACERPDDSGGWGFWVVSCNSPEMLENRDKLQNNMDAERDREGWGSTRATKAIWIFSQKALKIRIF